MRFPHLAPLLCLAATTAPLLAQSVTTPPAGVAPANEPSVAEVQAFIPKIDAMIASREERATRLANEMKAHDQRIEAGIKALRDQITRATDSQASKTRVAKLKREFITGLENAAKAYAGKRAELEESLRQAPNPYTREDLFKARGAIDARIDKRVEDIVAVASTFDAHKDLEKYIYHPGYDQWGNGWDGVWEDNPEYEQNRRASRAGNQGKEAVTRDLDQAVDRLSLKLAGLKEQQRTAGTSSQAMADEIKRVEELLQQRTAQRDSLLSAPPETPTTPIGLQEAINLDKEIETTASDLRQDFTAIFQCFRDWQSVRAQLTDCKLRRDRAITWLEAHQASSPK